MSKKLVIGAIIALIIIMPLTAAIEIEIDATENSESSSDHPNRPLEKMIMIGRYNRLEEQRTYCRSLKIDSYKGNIWIIVGEWEKSGYSSWSYWRLISNEYIHFEATHFLGYCSNGRICGIALGDFRYY